MSRKGGERREGSREQVCRWYILISAGRFGFFTCGENPSIRRLRVDFFIFSRGKERTRTHRSAWESLYLLHEPRKEKGGWNLVAHIVTDPKNNTTSSPKKNRAVDSKRFPLWTYWSEGSTSSSFFFSPLPSYLISLGKAYDRPKWRNPYEAGFAASGL